MGAWRRLGLPAYITLLVEGLPGFRKHCVVASSSKP
jgi:hypothetical protein